MNHDECKTYIKNSLLEIRKLANIYTLETFKKELEKRNIYLETKSDKYFSSEGEDYIVKHVTPYSNRMTEAIISRLSDQGYNLVIEGTGRTTDVPIQTATMLQAKGYETKMYVMAVPKINSYLGTIERYETMYADDPMTARATPKQAHDIVVKNLPTNLETLHKTGLFSDIRLYNREGVKLYSSLETPSISPKETLERES